MSALATLAIRATLGWDVRGVTLAVAAGQTLAVTLEAAAPPAERLPGAALERIGAAEVAIARAPDGVRIYAAHGNRGWLGVLAADVDETTIAAAAALLAGARTEEVAPVLSAAYSVAELAAAAELAGLAGFPGVEEARLPDQRARVDARRALAARGTVVETAEGGLAFAARERPLLEVALRPAAVLDAERRSGADMRRAVVAWTPTTSVAQLVVRSGVIQLTGFPSTALPDWLAAFGGADELIVRILRRDGARLAGHELRWSGAVDADDVRGRLAEALDAAVPTG